MNFDKTYMPKHIAIIMDGNRRWAKAQGKPASFGHKEGAKTLDDIKEATEAGTICGICEDDIQEVLDELLK